MNARTGASVDRRGAGGGRPGGRVRHGSVYVLVLVSAMLLTVIGLGVLALARVQIARDSAARDLDRASALAMSGVHAAMAYINTEGGWRDKFATGNEGTASGDTMAGGAAGPGATVRFWAEAPLGGLLPVGSLGRVRVVGVGEYNDARRTYTALAEPAVSVGLDVLRCALHGAGGVSASGAKVIDGPLSSDAKVANTGILSAAIECQEFDNRGTHTGTVVVPSPPKQMPSRGNALSLLATPISYGSIPSGCIEKRVLSPLTNPYGLPNVRGVYSITVPRGQTLKIKEARLLATLLVTLQADAKFELDPKVNWQPAETSLPTLVIRGLAGAQVTLSGDDNAVSESSLSTNFNPVGAPYGGQTDGDLNDTYPAEIQGVIDVVDPIVVEIMTKQRIFGCVIAAGTVSVGGDAVLIADPALMKQPPEGYTAGGATMQVVRGSWRWASYDEVTPPGGGK